MLKNENNLPDFNKLKNIQGIAFYNPYGGNDATAGIAAIPVSNSLSKIIKNN